MQKVQKNNVSYLYDLLKPGTGKLPVRPIILNLAEVKTK